MDFNIKDKNDSAAKIEDKSDEMVPVAETESMIADDPIVAAYTCLPNVQNYLIVGLDSNGEQVSFQFDKGYLYCTASQSALFESTMEGQPIPERMRIRRMKSLEVQPQSSSMIQGLDHSGNTGVAPSAVQEA